MCSANSSFALYFSFHRFIPKEITLQTAVYHSPVWDMSCKMSAILFLSLIIYFIFVNLWLFMLSSHVFELFSNHCGLQAWFKQRPGWSSQIGKSMEAKWSFWIYMWICSIILIVRAHYVCFTWWGRTCFLHFVATNSQFLCFFSEPVSCREDRKCFNSSSVLKWTEHGRDKDNTSFIIFNSTAGKKANKRCSTALNSSANDDNLERTKVK